jgi:hypothetical protein
MLLVMVFVVVGGAGGDLVVMLVMGLVDLGLGWFGGDVGSRDVRAV